MAKLEKDTRRELTAAVAARYRSSTKSEKALILDEFTAITGFHRKHAIRLLFCRLQVRYPGTFKDGQLRTLQRRVKAWRHQAALRLVLAPSCDDAPSSTEWVGNMMVSQTGSKGS